MCATTPDTHLRCICKGNCFVQKTPFRCERHSCIAPWLTLTGVLPPVASLACRVASLTSCPYLLSDIKGVTVNLLRTKESFKTKHVTKCNLEQMKQKNQRPGCSCHRTPTSAGAGSNANVGYIRALHGVNILEILFRIRTSWSIAAWPSLPSWPPSQLQCAPFPPAWQP